MRFFSPLPIFEPSTLDYLFNCKVITYTLPYHWATSSHVLYNPFHSYNDLKWKSFQLQNCRSGRSLQLLYILFFPFEDIWKFEIQNWNHVFGCQNNLNWKKFQLQSCKLGWDIQLLYILFFNLRLFEFFKIACSNIIKGYKGDAPWCYTSPMSSQRWRALMMPVTFDLSKPITYTNLIGDVF